MNPILVLILLIVITGSAVFFTKKRGMKQQDELVEAIIEETVTELVEGGDVEADEMDAPAPAAVLGRRSRNGLLARLRRAAKRAARRPAHSKVVKS